MARESSGTVFESPRGSGHWHGKFTTPAGRHSILLVTCHTREAAEARKRFMVEQISRLREAGRAEFIRRFLELAARADDARLDRVRRGVDAIVAGDFERPSAPDALPDVGPTFQEFAEQWTSGELRRRFPDHVREKRSVSDDIFRLRAHVYPLVGSVPLRQFTTQHAEAAMAALPTTLSPASRRQVAQLLARVLKLAVYPARVLERSPLPVGFLPKVGPARALAWLRPDEDARLLRAEPDKVPLLYRLLYGFLAREGLRKSEALALTWSALDLEHGVLTLDQNKTDDPRAWALDPGVVRALRRWKGLCGEDAKPDTPVFSWKGQGVGPQHLAITFRAHLESLEGIRRELFQSTALRRPIRIHDQRATFVTLSLALGKTETWVADRTGHKSSVMINRYRRAARTAAELNLGPLLPLDQAIPELRAIVHETSTANSSGRQGRRFRPRSIGRRGGSRPPATRDTPLGSGGATRGGSSPLSCTERSSWNC
jgi:integrase